MDVRASLDGEADELLVRQADGKTWRVDAQHVRAVGDEIVLKGPREGFHIWPIAQEPEIVSGTLHARPEPAPGPKAYQPPLA